METQSTAGAMHVEQGVAADAASSPATSDFRAFGELDLAFSTDLQLAWTTWGGHCDQPVAFFNGAVDSGSPAPFFNLGSYAMAAETDPGNPDSSKIAALMVRAAAQANPEHPPLAAPTEYRELWNDSRSHADMDGTCWEPVAPQGYTALGAYFQSGHGNPPASNDRTVMVCVRNDLLAQVKLGPQLWGDHGSHHHGDLSVWLTEPAALEPNESTMYVTGGTFVATPSYDTPGGPFYALQLPVLAHEPSVTVTVPPMTGHSRPADPPPQVDHLVEVPFTAITDPAKSNAWQVANSPFYVIKRSVGYRCLEFYDNQTERDTSGQWQITTGVTEEESKQFSASVGISISAEAGVKVFGIGTKITATVTSEFGWTQGSARSQMTSESSTLGYDVPPMHACALWKLDYSFHVGRADGTQVPGELAFPPSAVSAVAEQFPPPSESGQQVVVREMSQTVIGVTPG